MMKRLYVLLAALYLAGLPALIRADGLEPMEQQIVDRVAANSEAAIRLLEEVVNINSGTLNKEGVGRVGEVFDREFSSLGMKTIWFDMPEEVERGGHLHAEVDGDQGQRILLIGHLDTVFEPDSPFQTFNRDGDRALGPGTEDMKGGNIVILHALKALHEVGVLKDLRIIAALTGDEEKPGEPLEISRRDLIEAGRRSDIALGFEAGVEDFHNATVARRGASFWTLRVSAKPAHSSQIFKDGYGAGAINEASRILQSFYAQIRGELYLTFNPGVILGGTEIDYDAQQNKGAAFGKSNVIAETAVVDGDLRFISEEQKERTRERMRAIVALSLPETEAEITFRDGYPAMEPSDANLALMSRLDQVSRDLGIGAVEPLDPSRRGAADISFVASDVEASLAGLGPIGWGGHTVEEGIDITTLEVATKRAAILIYRLSRE